MYLASAAHVAASLGGRGPAAPAVARLPPEKRLTFGGDEGQDARSALESLDVLLRCESMRKACEEARGGPQPAGHLHFQPNLS